MLQAPINCLRMPDKIRNSIYTGLQKPEAAQEISVIKHAAAYKVNTRQAEVHKDISIQAYDTLDETKNPCHMTNVVP